MTPTTTTPKLAAPGAGLPMIELVIANVLLRLRLLFGSREAFNARFENERRAIRALIASCHGEDGARRVLIARPPGLEDSSRDWSVWMTLDHLRIVHHEVAGVMDLLGRGITPTQKVSTAAVKPDPHVTGAVIADYEASCDTVMAAVAAVPNLRTASRLAHPWFGPMDAFAWHGLLGGHMGIHRVQIQRILQQLARSERPDPLPALS